MHVVFLEFVQNWGGAPRSSVELAKRLSQHVKVSIVDPNGCCKEFGNAVKEAGLDYYVLCPESQRPYIGGQGNIFKRCVKVAKALPEIISIQRKAETLLKDIKASVVCSNNPKSLSIAGTSFKLRSMPLVGFLRGWYRPQMIPFYAKYLYQKRCNLLFAVSNATRAAVICAGIKPEKIVTLPNPIDSESVQNKSCLPLDKPLPHEERKVKLLLPGGLMRTKGQHTAIKALPYILEKGFDTVLYLAGSLAPGGDKNYIAETKALAENLGVSNRVEWLGMRYDIPQIMKQASVVILPTHTEGMPRSLLEAMVLAKPVAATPVGGIMDLIIHKMTGLYFNVEDEKGLAECVNYYLTCPDEAVKIAKNAQANMLNNYTVEQHTNNALKSFESIVRK